MCDGAEVQRARLSSTQFRYKLATEMSQYQSLVQTKERGKYCYDVTVVQAVPSRQAIRFRRAFVTSCNGSVCLLCFREGHYTIREGHYTREPPNESCFIAAID